jgi:hypothetical protein
VSSGVFKAVPGDAGRGRLAVGKERDFEEGYVHRGQGYAFGWR